jgi:hypothetical protein
MMMDDCCKYFRECEACQRFGDVQSASANMLHLIIKPWPFRGWGLDFVREIHPSSSKGHRFVLVAVDYFTKWTEAVPLKNMTLKEVISFMLEHIMYRFGLSQTLTIDQGAAFMVHQIRQFTASLKIKLLNSSPYYAQANGQAKSSNKILIRLIKKKIEEQPLVFRQEAVLPVEVNLQACQVSKEDDLLAEEYGTLMMDKLDEVPESRLRALREIEKEKVQVARAYNKKVRGKSFQTEDMV